MRRSILVALVTAIVAGGLAAGATVLLTDDDDTAVSTPPVTTEGPGATLPPSPSRSPAATQSSTEPAPAPGRSATPTATTPATSPATTIRAAKSVNCDTEPKKCSESQGMRVMQGKLQIVEIDDPAPNYSGAPRITMSSEYRKADESEASNGDEVKSIHVQAIVENTTDRTFVFAKREIALDIFKDGKLYDTLVTTGPGFDMTPGGKMTATFDRPITTDGNYVWRAKTWYYEK